MRQAIGWLGRVTAAVQLLCLTLPACRPSDFDGLHEPRGPREALDPSQRTDAEGVGGETRDAEPEQGEPDSAAPHTATDAQAPDAELDAGAGDAGRADTASDAAMIDASALDGSASDASASMDAGSDAQTDAAVRDSATTDSAQAQVDAGPITVRLPILADRDDTLWLNANGGLEERLHFSPSDGAAGYTIEVGSDSEMCRLGLRFALPFGHGARVISARLSLRRVGPAGDADATSTMAVRVFESDSVPPFDGTHTHGTPGGHDPGGVWLGQAVTGYAVGTTNAWNESPDLAALVQHVIDRSAFRAGNYLGFVLSPDVLPGTQYAQFRDSFAGEDPAVLTVSYQP